MSTRTRSTSLALLLALAAVFATFALPAAAASAPPGCANRTNTTYQSLLTCVTLDGVRAHQQALQNIATANGGTRAVGTPGYTKSVEYVSGLLRKAGYTVTLDDFQYLDDSKTLLRQITPVAATYETGAFTGSAVGHVIESVTPVDINLTLPRDSTSGCEAGDFAGFPAGNIALIQRGTCTFADKAVNAQVAGAVGVIIFNQGNTPEREGLIVGTLVPSSAPITIPVVGASFADGSALAQAGSTAEITVAESTSQNVIAEMPGRNTNNVVMAGAHLDSVPEGPGINDNGSGSAAILETALMLAKVKPQNTIRFAWWGAEELGLVGSTAYVNGLSQDEKDRIALYMNYDMVGSPNYVTMVYDADESTFAAADQGVVVPDGSVAIEDLYESYYTKIGEPYDDSAFDGRSDYQAFIDNDIASGGLFTGAEEEKTVEQQAIWGGTVGAQFDPCYHLACDTFANNNDHVLDVNSDLIAFAMLTYAFSTESVNGVPGQSVPGGASFELPPPAGPEHTFEP
jgi:Zn-dependent M28 family amino/carboxypeptidase